eukprot:CAMPEP_0204131990 /NCGR_PEP_ID=MMETSP0361-20130328/14265_1 /ASSEMBLY_ACC=CAM_ASM_000343 /TAXON_ID=268821 /ORGANISM="Scrippsiella Hangoei, Strain SHTV-5" /LENGTH=169 /DNA_ID=CAMNT_0051084825 /DNA_START=122 /DNA_END=628 /DNA_ORIENTATION=-
MREEHGVKDINTSFSLQESSSTRHEIVVDNALASEDTALLERLVPPRDDLLRMESVHAHGQIANGASVPVNDPVDDVGYLRRWRALKLELQEAADRRSQLDSGDHLPLVNPALGFRVLAFPLRPLLGRLFRSLRLLAHWGGDGCTPLWECRVAFSMPSRGEAEGPLCAD